MGKPKKGRKGRTDDDFSDDETSNNPLKQDDSDLAELTNAMGKGRKGRKQEINSEETDGAVQESAPKLTKKGKKSKKKANDDWENDVADELSKMAIDEGADDNGVDNDEEVAVIKKKEKKKKHKIVVDYNDDVDEGDDEASKPSLTSFQAFMGGDDHSDDDGSDGESSKDDKKEIIVENVVEVSSKAKKDKKPKKKEKSKTKEEEDIDALLAELDKPAERKKKKKGKKVEGEIQKADDVPADEQESVEAFGVKVVTMDDLDEEYDDKRKKKKNKIKKAEGKVHEDKKDEEKINVEDKVSDGVKIERQMANFEMKIQDEVGTINDGSNVQAEVEIVTEEVMVKDQDGKVNEEGNVIKEIGGTNDEDGATMTAAQKKKDKKDKEKLKKKKEKKKTAKPAEKDEGKAAHGETSAMGKVDDAQATNKEKSKEDESSSKRKLKPGNKQVEAMRARLKLIQEEEAQMEREEKERIKREDEEERIREAEEKIVQERKAKKKQLEKERKDRLKAEGKLLTAKQKKDKQRSEQMLSAMLEQGLTIPTREGGVAKKVVYREKRKRKDVKGTGQKEGPKEGSPTEEEAPKEKVIIEVPPVPDTKDDEDDDIKDAWDLSESEEEEEVKEDKKAAPIDRQIAKVVETADAEDEESDDDSDDTSGDESDSSSEESSSDDDGRSPIERARIKIEKWHDECEKHRSVNCLRAPVVCVLGHVDTGKTKILDKLRRTNVQDGEAGGITQQIGATNVPIEAILEQTSMCKDFQKGKLRVPGLLIIDTPGHESFSNLRTRGSSLCDIAILVIDIMHGLEPQTIESINLLKSRNTPFVIALNKVDRIYQWKPGQNLDVQAVLKKQQPVTKSEFEERLNKVMVEMAEQGLNTTIFYKNKDPSDYISMVPTSAHSGDGMGNLLHLVCELSQTLPSLAKRISYSEALQATVMEVKSIPGLGTTIDVILVNGKITEGSQMILAGTEGPIVTHIRGILMPQPMRELRVKNQYEHHKEVKAAQGVKIIAKDLDKALAGLPLYVTNDPDEVEFYKNEVALALKDVLESIKLSERGVFVQASTLGSLEALLEYLRTSKINYAGINIGPVHKKDIMKASVMLEHDSQYSVILAFDVKVEREAQELADNLGVKIFTADIIYHLFDSFMEYRAVLRKKKREEFKHVAVFPCKLRILPQCIFNSRDPIVMGVFIEHGFLKEGTPLCVPSREFVDIGRVVSIESNHKTVDMARQGQEVCIKIACLPGDTPKLYGRHFDFTDTLVSKISRDSINAVKDYFREDMQKQDWMLIVELKKQFEII